MKKVFGQIGRLKPECIELYCKLHQQDVYTSRWAVAARGRCGII